MQRLRRGRETNRLRSGLVAAVILPHLNLLSAAATFTFRYGSLATLVFTHFAGGRSS
jgi:hypothetical protein